MWVARQWLEVMGAAKPAEGLEEEARGYLREGSRNEGCDIKASIPFEDVLS
jgi:hypothetical protein